ncbi:hypothetical protein BP5796_08192 [Coleophoma crateriformis]|uniref:Uncharacterized protein n=1 Tax=Coleophoma crateriformis TaxID=565419 RepID=A0A3D8RE14_9HELO|nr:hypothetical protein BP5796_08192 [Coleophoma crateriformis]
MGSRHRRASSYNPSTRELLDEAEDRNARLNDELRREQYNFRAQQREMQILQDKYARLKYHHDGCRDLQAREYDYLRDIKTLKHKLREKEAMLDSLDQRHRLLKRTNCDRLRHSDVERLYTKLKESEDARAIAEIRNQNKDRAVNELRAQLARFGFRVDLHKYGY